MPDDAEFIAQILANPGDDGPRLVYADWLDEQGDPRGEFIRVECELHTLSADDPRASELRAKLRECGTGLALTWVATVSHGRIDDCSLPNLKALSIIRAAREENRPLTPDESERIRSLSGTRAMPDECPGSWDLLVPTERAFHRSCPVCRCSVDYRSEEQLRAFAHANGDFICTHVIDPRIEPASPKRFGVGREEPAPPSIPAGGIAGGARPVGWFRRIVQRLGRR